MDVKSTFLNRELEENIYIVQSASFIVDGKEDMVLKLDKALYGLRVPSLSLKFIMHKPTKPMCVPWE
ncbi:hypothetical protein E2562_001875 [Oryza meyeriana var. granulata]|uniref:Reverse transcriptase Ty1/copia-type domain-containing protein n=1 Tax=Oryza meyeriana var. granulata TaxID=110450 RepID=A0A6G1C1P3_9ORYZ|nr:hypothetical protein E2562_001875 [Oryza meyeriana var. granulata]